MTETSKENMPDQTDAKSATEDGSPSVDTAETAAPKTDNETKPAASPAATAPLAQKSPNSEPAANKPKQKVEPKRVEVVFTHTGAAALYKRALKLASESQVAEADLKQLRKDFDELKGTEDVSAEDVDAVESQLGVARAHRHSQIEKRDRQLSIIDDSLDKLDAAVEAGNLKDAQSLEQKITARITAVDTVSAERKAGMTARLEAVQPKLRELRDWRKWGTGQARDKLIESVIALADSKLSPPQIAAEIRRARETWQSWDKSGDVAGKGLWEKFDAACTVAYEPCKSWFEQQNVERTANLKTRTDLIERLERLGTETDWANPDWRDIDKSVMSIRNSWRKAGPVDRKKRKSIDKRFDAAVAIVHEPLDRERKRCIKARELLIETVTALKEEADIRKAVDTTRDAQKNWRPSVLANHRVERRLWKDFKAACDAIFERRGESQKARDAEFQVNLQKREAILGEIDKLGKGTDDEVLAGNTNLNKLRRDFADSGPVGRRSEGAIEKRLRASIKNFEKRLNGIRQQQNQARHASYDELARLCMRAEALLETPNPDEAATIGTEFTAIDIADDATGAALRQRFEHVMAAIQGDDNATEAVRGEFSSNQTMREAILLELEVNAEIDSPNEFADARMQLQVNRLAAAMGKAKTKDSGGKIKDTRDLIAAWWTTGGASPDSMPVLQQRFERVRAALKGER